ncbi:hypothetical protein EHR10_11675 [Leptospira yasudae]|nr:LIC_10705 family lipoprotein [Leptospira yasudae]TGM98119.1 hypothetical protein EHR10_11675 [Leptospira yasudae]
MNLLHTTTIKSKGMIMLMKALLLSFFFLASWSCDNLKEPDPHQGTTNGIDNNFLLTYGFFFVLPDLDFNQYCPPTDQIPILEPGTHTRFMQAGDTYIFDNRARLNGTYTGFSSEFFTFTIQEAPGQEIRLVSPLCGLSPDDYRATGDSGASGQLENIYISLKIPPFPKTRSGFFTKIKAISGSGTITFTTPASQDPPNAH